MPKKKNISNYLPHWAGSKKRFKTYDPDSNEKRVDLTREPVYTIFHYDQAQISEHRTTHVGECNIFAHTDKITWINVDGLNKRDVDQLCAFYNVHPLLVEDILSIGQRAKMDEVEGRLFCLLPMIYYTQLTNSIEMEQVSLVIGEGFVISFQEDPTRDVFDPVRAKLRNSYLRIRERGADYLCYSLLDVIVDSYFGVLEKLNENIEFIEEKLINKQEHGVLGDISVLRREVMLMKRAIAPVKELVSGFLRSSNDEIEERNEKYFKDVLDHIIQANENCDNLRDMLSNLQDLYMNQINIRMNEVMKIFTMVSLLLAPATVIGGVFGMNFESIPLLKNPVGFYFSVSAMLIIPILMLIYFKKKKWF